jgi:hypothetical protein
MIVKPPIFMVYKTSFMRNGQRMLQKDKRKGKRKGKRHKHKQEYQQTV